jgi:hypothetical protein
MRIAIVLLSALALGACTINPPPEPVVATTYVPPAPPEQDCDKQKISRIVEKNLPTALKYPENSAHREMYIDTMFAEFDSMQVFMTPFQKRLCAITIKMAIQDVRLRLEGDQ